MPSVTGIFDLLCSADEECARDSAVAVVAEVDFVTPAVSAIDDVDDAVTQSFGPDAVTGVGLTTTKGSDTFISCPVSLAAFNLVLAL